MTTETATLPNPLREGLQHQRTPEPNAFVIFGASGDLTRRKLVPALFRLYTQRLLPPGFSIIGVARRPKTDEDFRAELRAAMAEEGGIREDLAGVWDTFQDCVRYVQTAFDDPSGYERLGKALLEEDDRRGTSGNRLYYLSTPPDAFAVIAHHLGEAGLAKPAEGRWARLVVEKPFGHDLYSARELNAQLHDYFDEQQIMRIDHYLGKETVQNILVFRFANAIFEPLWNRRYVDHVEITVAESLGMEGRGGYYETSGALRDMVQNHMLQVLSLVTMEPPATFGANAVRDEKVKVLRAVRTLTEDQVRTDVVRARYVPGMVAGRQVPGYRQEDGVSPESETPTYVALKLMIDNWRWAGVPFYLRHGKRLPKRVTEIAMVYNRPPLRLFREDGEGRMDPNTIIIRIQPDEGISIKFAAKAPGPAMDLRTVNMDFLYGESFGVAPPEAYERLLLDAMLGDHTLFARSDEVEVAWSILTPLLQEWTHMKGDGMAIYEAGTWGPAAADALIERDGRRWRRL
ncbi:MAG: glucose-6-phosphate dehydrogenase [Chloroflexi bacterium]|nr:glucose-6-phosphate dehydrogenase [Chloroflexota bacterium]